MTNAEKGIESGDDVTTDLILADRGCCFCFPCFGSSDRSTVEIEERWWKKGWRAVMKARELSEIVAGPKWKTFIRRIRKNGGRGGSKQGGKFQYDPLSYALNFDVGNGQIGNPEAEFGYRDFSTRFVAPLVSAKSSVDFGKDVPDFSASAGR